MSSKGPLAIATLLAVVENETILTDSLFVNHIGNNRINTIPAQLLCTLVISAIAYYHYATTRVIAYAGSHRSQNSFRVIC